MDCRLGLDRLHAPLVALLLLSGACTRPGPARPEANPEASPDNRCPANTHPQTSKTAHLCLTDHGVKEGPARSFFADGQRKDTGAWHDNKRHGAWTFWDDDGSLLQHAEFVAGKVVAMTPNLSACPPGAVLNGQTPAVGGHAVWCQTHDAAGAWRNHGPFMSWHDDGQPQAKGTYVNAVPDGPFAMWFADGSPKVRGTYARGEEQGLWLSWHDNGHLFIRAWFVDGKESGPWISWWEEGAPCAEGEFVRGLEHGAWTFWRPNGGKSEAGTYSNGKKNGWWSAWDATGKPQPMQEYRAGVMISSGGASAAEIAP